MTPTYYHTFANGIQLVHRHTDSAVAYAGIMVGAGTRDEQSRLNGMAHYIEHCVFKGAQTLRNHHWAPLTAQQIIHRIEDVGGEINAYTTKEETVYYAATPNTFLGRTLHLLLDMVFHPTFPKEETDKELGVILDEIESYNDSPSELIYDDFEHLLFDGNTLGLPILGTRPSLRTISRTARHPLTFMHHHYRPERMVVFTQSRTPFLRIVQLLDNLFQTNEPTYQPLIRNNIPNKRITPQPPQQHTAAYTKHTHQVHIMLGGYAFPLGHPCQLPLYLINHILGGGALSSRLNMSLREQSGLVYTVESQYTPLSDTGYWNVYLATEPQHKDRCIELVRKELLTLMNDPLSTIQLHRALQQLHGQMAIAAENNENNALTMAKQMLYYGMSEPWQQTYERLLQLTPLDLTDTARQVFQPNQQYMLCYE